MRGGECEGAHYSLTTTLVVDTSQYHCSTAVLWCIKPECVLPSSLVLLVYTLLLLFSSSYPPPLPLLLYPSSSTPPPRCTPSSSYLFIGRPKQYDMITEQIVFRCKLEPGLIWSKGPGAGPGAGPGMGSGVGTRELKC